MIRDWWVSRIRMIEVGRWYFRLTPHLGVGTPWFKDRGRKTRLRASRYHGVQRVTWYGARWVVTKQLLGRSRVKGESMDLERRF